ncbi:hypothetical protein [Pontibacter liquoris]|uniref:hypothetical protein n=1 Tax=Pontibacter liquoris TaxID=2905677 RepID=UPI001FA6CD67|nr:hypothetical protein [Pontibacter liquoris]
MEKTLSDEELKQVKAAIADRRNVMQEILNQAEAESPEELTKHRGVGQAIWSKEVLESALNKLEGCVEVVIHSTN